MVLLAVAPMADAGADAGAEVLLLAVASPKAGAGEVLGLLLVMVPSKAGAGEVLLVVVPPKAGAAPTGMGMLFLPLG